MVEILLLPILLALIPGIPLAIYSGVIVARYYGFDSSLARARSFVLNLEQTWTLVPLPQRIPDPESDTGWRSVHMSRTISSNAATWQLLQLGLELKEQGHWSAAEGVDRVAFQIEDLRGELLERARTEGSVRVSVTEHIADWHRQLSRLSPRAWVMLKPWPNVRYQNLACISVNEATGEWREVRPQQNQRDG
jgi:hypothetical protein